MTMVDTMTYVSTATQTDYMTATVTSVSVSTLVEPTTYISTLLSTYVKDEVSRLLHLLFILILTNLIYRPRQSSIL
jgi:hypothetical protein